MTTAAETKVSEKDAAKEALKVREKEIAEKEKALNADRSGKGTRAFIGMTRGRNPQMIQYEGFDETQPDTLPKTISEFMDIAKVTDEPTIMGYIIDGYNSAAYTNASDPVAEFVDAAWPEEFQKQFRTVVKNYSSATKLSIEDTVALLKPSMVATLAKA